MLPAGPTPERALARLCLNTPAHAFNVNATLHTHGGAGIQGARSGLTDALVALKVAEPKLDGPLSERILTTLRMIGAKVRPEFTKAQADPWLKAVLTGLSDLPGKCLNTALLDALHVPFAFPNEVEAKVRDLAQLERSRLQIAIHRLDQMQAEILRQRDCSNRIEDQRHEPLDTAEVHKLQRSRYGKELVRVGLALGSITPDQLLPPDELTNTTKGGNHGD